jgi:hypothetical protein
MLHALSLTGPARTRRPSSDPPASPAAIADGSDYGAEIINGATEELRLRLAKRMNITDLLHNGANA